MFSNNAPSIIRDGNYLKDNDLCIEFDTRSELSKTESQISYGNRISQFGFTDMFGLGKTTPQSSIGDSKPSSGVKQSSKQTSNGKTGKKLETSSNGSGKGSASKKQGDRLISDQIGNNDEFLNSLK